MANSKNNKIDGQLAELLDISEDEIVKAIENAKKLVSFDGKKALSDLMTKLDSVDPGGSGENESLEITTSDVEETYVKAEEVPSNQDVSLKPPPPETSPPKVAPPIQIETPAPEDEFEVNIEDDVSLGDPNEISGVFRKLRDESNEPMLAQDVPSLSIDKSFIDETIDESQLADDHHPLQEEADERTNVEFAPEIDEKTQLRMNDSDLSLSDDFGNLTRERTYGEEELEVIEELDLDDSDLIEIEDDFGANDHDEFEEAPISTSQTLPLPPELGLSPLDADELAEDDMEELTGIRSHATGLDSFVDVPEDDDFDIDLD